MRKALIPLTLLALIALGCDVDSANPVAELSESEPIPELWHGVWDAVEILDREARVPFSIEISNNADGSVQLLVREGPRALLENASFTQVGGARVASIASEHGGWSLFAFEIVEADLTMTVRALDLTVVKADIEAGIVPGEVSEIGLGDEVIGLTASSAELRSYLASHPTAFSSDVLATFQKRTSS